MKYTEVHNTLEQPLFCSINLLFGAIGGVHSLFSTELPIIYFVCSPRFA